MTWNIDTAHSAATFKVRHMGISSVRGTFSGITGTVETDASGRPSSVKASIPVSTVSTGQADRDAHLQAPDFFDVAQYPNIEFVSTSITPSGSDYVVEGNLTLHGMTKPIRFEAEISAPVTDPMSGKKKMGAEATLDISRKDYGLTWNAAIEAGGVMVGDKVSIQLELQAVEG